MVHRWFPAQLTVSRFRPCSVVPEVLNFVNPKSANESRNGVSFIDNSRIINTNLVPLLKNSKPATTSIPFYRFQFLSIAV